MVDTFKVLPIDYFTFFYSMTTLPSDKRCSGKDITCNSATSKQYTLSKHIFHKNQNKSFEILKIYRNFGYLITFLPDFSNKIIVIHMRMDK